MTDHAEWLLTPPVMGFSDEYTPGFVAAWHAHDMAQLLYAAAGVMQVVTRETSFVVPPQRAVWIPGHIEHEVSSRGPVSLRTLYFDDATSAVMQAGCRVLEISDVVRALVLELVARGTVYEPTERDRLMLRLLFLDLAETAPAPFHVAMPQDARLRRLCLELIADPSDNRDLDACARAAAMGRRTFTRRFRAETGMSMTVWRQQARLMEALNLLAAGHSITAVAFDVGYDSSSGFSSMFHRAFGMSPSHYLGR